MSDDLAEWLRSQVDYVEMDEDYEILVPAGKVRDAAAEITRLRAELATARREGMEDAAKIVIARGWRHERLAAAIRAAAGEVK